jgi:hypothetical protein
MNRDIRRFRFSDGARGRVSQLVRDVLEARGWRETTGGDWTIYWDVEIPAPDILRMSGPHQLCNRFPGIGAIGSKEWLHRTLRAARQRLEPYGLDGLLDITPRTFLLPEEYGPWIEAARWDPDRVWICKPKHGSRGCGVALVESVQDINDEASLIVQEYIDRPRLISGRKFTLRFYVLLTSISPLVAYVHEDGFVKLASRPFSVAPEHRADRFRHLTNPDVLRHDPALPASDHNLSHRVYRAQLSAEGSDADAVWQSIRRALAATLMAARGMMTRMQARDAPVATCFELLGCDVTLDEHLRPFLLECNYAPSLSVEAAPGRSTSAEEHEIKRRVLDDTIALVEAGHLSEGAESPYTGPEARLGRELSHRGGFSLLVPSPTSLPLTPVFEQIEHTDLDVLPVAIPTDASPWGPTISPRVVSAVVDGHCVVAHCDRRDLYVLNRVASAIWTGFEEGVPPATLGREIADATGVDQRRVELDVWASLVDWTRAGLLFGAAEHEAQTEGTRAPLPQIGWNEQHIYRILQATVAVHAPPDVLRRWIHPTLRAFEAREAVTIDLSVEAVSHRTGWELHTSCGTVRCVPEEGALAAELHMLIDRLALARRGALFVFMATLEEAEDGAHVLVGGRPADERLLVRRDDDGVAGVAREDGRDVNAVAFDLTAGEARSACRTISPGEGLQRLLADPAASPFVVDARAARALAEVAARVSWRVPSC